MVERYTDLAEYFVHNVTALRDAYGREEGMLYPVCAAILLERERPITAEELKGLRDHIRMDDDFTGDFKGPAVVPIACMLAASDHPEELTLLAPDLYRQMTEKVPRSAFLAMTILGVVDVIPKTEWKRYIDKTARIYTLMEQRELLDHDGEALVAALLAMTDKPPERAVFELEELRQRIKPLFPLRSSARAVSVTLSIAGGSNDQNLRHIERFTSALHTAGMKLGGNHSMGLLGALSFSKYDTKRFLERMREADMALAQQSGYRGLFAVPRKR
ncbi:MAG: DUF4003 family protein, partial [Clostridia bacterium]|nr:DUF4003 family protein [Clostridia bacterium]